MCGGRGGKPLTHSTSERFVPHPLSLGESAVQTRFSGRYWEPTYEQAWEQEQSLDVLKINDLLNAFYPSPKKILPASFTKKSKNGHTGLPRKVLKCKCSWNSSFKAHRSGQVLAVHIPVSQREALKSTHISLGFANSWPTEDLLKESKRTYCCKPSRRPQAGEA